jgi:hypothetical protein
MFDVSLKDISKSIGNVLVIDVFDPYGSKNRVRVNPEISGHEREWFTPFYFSSLPALRSSKGHAQTHSLLTNLEGFFPNACKS